MTEFDPELVEQAARAAHRSHRCLSPAEVERIVRAVLTAVAPTLRAEGAPWARCTGASDCPEEWHEHGCFSDDCQCSDPNDHDGWDAGYQRGKVDGAREVFADLEAAIAEQRITLLNDGVRITTERIHAAAREAVARIEKGGAVCGDYPAPCNHDPAHIEGGAR